MRKNRRTLLGVTQQSVAMWFSSNTSDCNTTQMPTPDVRVKLNTVSDWFSTNSSDGNTTKTPTP
jgi:hypothetical protein